jgi:hypothetical protein
MNVEDLGKANPEWLSALAIKLHRFTAFAARQASSSLTGPGGLEFG